MKRTPLTRKTPLKATTIRASGRRPKMTEARKSAKGQPCMVRLPGCDGGGETTVLAHYRLAGTCGTGTKPPDVLGAWACWFCHECCDGRAPAPEGYSRDQVRLAHAEGVLRTIVATKEEWA